MNDEQPLHIGAGGDLRLRRQCPLDRRTLPWDPDRTPGRQVDDIDHSHDLPLLRAMYGCPCRNGECDSVRARERRALFL